jgi:putrescine aminotransferase
VARRTSTTVSADTRAPVTLEEALAAPMETAMGWYADAVSPVDIAEAAPMRGTGAFVRARGATLTDERGVDYLDALAGFGAVNLGHNHPDLLAALHAVDELPGFLQLWPSPLYPALALTLLAEAPAGLGKVFLCNSGGEAVESALKLVRATSRRPGLLSTDGAFHGKTLGALSVSGRPVYQEPFRPLVPGCERVPFGDVDALASALRTRRYGGFVVEPIQGEAGVIVPPDGYLADAAELCHETGTLLVVDEVQTGFGRTGAMFACEHEGVRPDVLCVAKALGGGLIPIGACISTTEVWERAYGSRKTARLHTTTFGGGTRACAVALKTIEVLRRDRIPERAAEMGERMLTRLRAIADRSPMLAEVRGRGLLIGLEFASPLVGRAVAREYGGTVTAVLLWQDHRIVTINTLHNPNVLRIEPPLTITDAEADRIVDAVEEVTARHRSVLGATARVGLRGLRGRRGGDAARTVPTVSDVADPVVGGS